MGLGPESDPNPHTNHVPTAQPSLWQGTAGILEATKELFDIPKGKAIPLVGCPAHTTLTTPAALTAIATRGVCGTVGDACSA